MDLDFDTSLVFASLALSAGAGLQLILWLPSPLAKMMLQALPVILPSSVALLALGFWRLIIYFKDRSLYEPIIRNSVGSFDQNVKLSEVSTHLEKLEGSLATFERVSLKDMAELRTRVEKLENVPRGTMEKTR